ncbi:TIGR01244 family sulfur transferase [Isoalcanivorax beigongshangi]|uniref:TIGR01244 family sulfur transferase n=1 Tax=Isoalcanivorax beigongshangi TaxID=3238810 RepID=A0ABV4AEJ4_9GAMM
MESLTRHTESFSTCAQIRAEDVAAIAEQGFRTLINNRPDAEGGDSQPRSEDIAKAAAAAGLKYIHIPVISGQITPEQVTLMRSALDNAEQPVLAFCRSGARSTQLWGLALQQSQHR